MGANRNQDNSTGGPSLVLAAVAADQDLLALHPYVVAGLCSIDKALLPRRITVMGAGDLVYEEQYSVAGALGTTVTLPIAIVPHVLDAGEVRTIKAATAATSILIQW